MKHLAFRMKLMPGYEIEYQRRHDEIWPELSGLLKSKGIQDYRIFLDSETGDLFAHMKVVDELELDDLPRHEIMKKWWAYMKDIMETNDDNSPISSPLKEVFSL